jgi:hypothetical protein
MCLINDQQSGFVGPLVPELVPIPFPILRVPAERLVMDYVGLARPVDLEVLLELLAPRLDRALRADDEKNVRLASICNRERGKRLADTLLGKKGVAVVLQRTRNGYTLVLP